MTRSHHFALPAGPPPEVLDEIGAAWERATEALLLACGDPLAPPV